MGSNDSAWVAHGGFFPIPSRAFFFRARKWLFIIPRASEKNTKQNIKWMNKRNFWYDIIHRRWCLITLLYLLSHEIDNSHFSVQYWSRRINHLPNAVYMRQIRLVDIQISFQWPLHLDIVLLIYCFSPFSWKSVAELLDYNSYSKQAFPVINRKLLFRFSRVQEKWRWKEDSSNISWPF